MIKKEVITGLVGRYFIYENGKVRFERGCSIKKSSIIFDGRLLCQKSLNAKN